MKNKSNIMICFVTALILMAAGAVPALSQDDKPVQIFEDKRLNVQDDAQYAPDEILVKFKSGVSNKKIDQINSNHEASVSYTPSHVGFKKLKIPKSKTVEEMVEIYSKNPNVEYSEPNFIVQASMVPNDPIYTYQWHLDNPVYGGIHMEDAWDISEGVHTSVIVAVLDTGVAYEDYGPYEQAPDLANTTFVPGYDFINNDAHPNDDNSHGTHVAGTIAQSTNNDLGVAGVAYDCSIMPVKVLNSAGNGSYSGVADGIIWATNNGAQVISMSLSGPSPSQTLEAALAYAYNNGVTIVCAAGNEYQRGNSPQYPAAYDDYCIAVGATRYDETRAPYSNTGPYLDIMAPGGDTSVDQNGDGHADGVLQNTFNPNTKDPADFNYWFFQGTSMAAPHVSGVAAVLIGEGVATNPDEVREALVTTADDLGNTDRDDVYGWGLVNAAAALNYGSVSTPNQPPVADLNGPYEGNEGSPITFDGSASSDPDGSIVSYDWNFGDGNSGIGETTTHTYTSPNTYTMTLKVTDNEGLTDTDTAAVTIKEETSGPQELFYDSFEQGEWNGLWIEDSQRDWFDSAQRSTDGSYSAEIDGRATDATLTSDPIDLQGTTSATITFSWYIESGLDNGEYLAFDVSMDGGATWTEKAILRGNVETENTWHEESIEVNGIDTLKIQFRGKMSRYNEDANVDEVRVIAH